MVIAASPHQPQLGSLMETHPHLASQIDEMIRRDYHFLSADLQESYETNMTRYLLWRRRYQDAVHFIYPRIYDGEEALSWKLDMNLAYARALLGQQSLDLARKQVEILKQSIAYYRNRGTTPEAELLQTEQETAELERQLLSLMKPAPS